MNVECSNCEEELPYDPSSAVEAEEVDKIVIYKYQGEGDVVIAQSEYYCDPDCFIEEKKSSDTIVDYEVIAPGHDRDLEAMQPYVIEGVAYSPNKMSYKSSTYDECLEVRCDSCTWKTTVGELPQHGMYVQPDVCPACAKNGDLGFVRTQSPADGSFPTRWRR